MQIPPYILFFSCLYLIVCCCRVAEDENDEQAGKFTIRLSDNICLKDPIMQFLLQKVQHMGHSIELLVSLDRIADIWRMDNENNGL